MGRPLCLSVVEHKSLAWQGVLGWGQGYDELSGNGQFATQRSHAYVKRFLKYRECKKRRHCSGSCHATSEDRVDVAAPQTGESRVRYGSACSQGPRETMEDVVHIIENGPCGFFFATVLDGHAGISSAQYLEEHLIDAFKTVLNEYTLGCSTEELDEGLCCPLELTSVLTESFKKADQKLLSWLEEQPVLDASSGCTATTVLVNPDKIIVANVGDSRAVMSRSTGSVDLSVEHRVYGRGEAVESETRRIEASGGWVEDGRVCGILAVSRAFGDADFKGSGLDNMLLKGIEDGFWTQEFAGSKQFVSDPVISVPDVLEMSIIPETDEFVIVASDGLWDVVSSDEGCKFVKNDLKKGENPTKAAQKLVDIATKRRTPDNVAVVVIDLKGEDFWTKQQAANQSKKMFGLF